MSKKLTWVFISIVVWALLTNANGSFALSSKKIFVIENIVVDESLPSVQYRIISARAAGVRIIAK